MNLETMKSILKRKLKKQDHSISILAILLAVLYVLGLVAGDIVIKQLHVFDRKAGIALLILVIMVAYFALYFLISSIFRAMDMAQTNNIRVNLLDILAFKHLTKTMLILIIAWMPYMVIRFPGNMDGDTLWQILEYYGYFPIKDIHPLFDGLIFSGFWKLGDLLGSNTWSLLLYTIAQMVVTSYVMAVVINYARALHIPKCIQTGICFFYAIYPVIPLFAQTMAKDMLHGWVFLLFALFYIDITRTKGMCLGDNKLVCLLTFVMIAVNLTKHTGCYVVLLSMVFLILYIKKHRGILLVITIIVLIFHFKIWSGIVLPRFDIKAQNTVGMWSVASQQVALILREKDDLTDDEYDILESVYNDLDGMVEGYNPVRTDNTHGHWRSDCGAEKKREFLKWYLKQYVFRPREMFLALLAQDYPLLVIDTYSAGDESCIFYRDNIPEKEVGIGGGYEQLFANWSGTDDVEGIHKILYTSYRLGSIKDTSNAFNNIYLHLIDIFPMLFSKVLFSTWVPLLVLFYAVHVRDVRIVLALIPDLLMTSVLAVGPIVLPRYMVSTVYLCPLIVCIPFIMKNIDS